MKTFEIAVFQLLAGLVIHVATRKANATNRLSVAKAGYFPDKKNQLAIRIVRRLAESYCRTFFIAGAEKWILN